jgi:hypothetical protein
VNPGRRLELGGRELTLLRPPSYDSASSLAVYDVTGSAYFGANSFGAILPDLVEDAAEADERDYLSGVALFTRANAPRGVDGAGRPGAVRAGACRDQAAGAPPAAQCPRRHSRRPYRHAARCAAGGAHQATVAAG